MARQRSKSPLAQHAKSLVEFGGSALSLRLPIFMALCLILGGTSQDLVEPKAILYGLSLVLIAWTIIIDGPRTKLYPVGFKRALTGPVIMMVAMIAIFLLYLVSLPSGLWTGLPGREGLKAGYEMVGMELPSIPLSLTPDATFNSIFDLLPPFAILLTVALTRSARELMLTLYAIMLIAVVSFPIGLMQAFSPGQFQFYEITNVGVPVGFFSNANHFASFNVLAAPLAIYVGSRGYRRLKEKEAAVSKVAMAAMALMLIITSVLLTESVAGYGLLMLVTVLSLPMVFAKQMKNPKVLMAAVAILGLFVAAAIIKAGDIQSLFAEKFSETSGMSRAILYDNTMAAVRSMGWAGSGPGSFYDVYLMYENRATMTTTFANQAHNDVLQIILELGVFGVGLLLAFGIWFVAACVKGGMASRRSRKLILILLVSILAVILHSFVEYPMRTIALASFTAFNVGYVSRLLRA